MALSYTKWGVEKMRLFIYEQASGEVAVFIQASHRNKADRIMARVMPNAKTQGRVELRKARFEHLDGKVVALATSLTDKQEAFNKGGSADEKHGTGNRGMGTQGRAEVGAENS